MSDATNKANTIDKVIELSNKKIQLLQELKDSLLAEKSDYIVQKASHSDYALVEKNSGAVKEYGSEARIKKYIEKRNITSVHWTIITK